jgi:hypothetical protein
MQLTYLHGYPDRIGKRFAFAGYGNGLASYTTGGDLIVLPSYDNYVDAVFGPVYSVSGNYLVTPIPSGYGPRQTWKLKWSPATESDAGVPLTLGPLSAAATTSAFSANGVGTVVGANTLSPGQFIVLSGGASGKMIFMNGQIVQVIAATSSQYSFNFAQAKALTYASAADAALKYQVVQVLPGNLLQAVALSAPITGVLATANLLTITQANSLSQGQFVVVQGLVAGEIAQGAIVQVASANSTSWTANWQGTILGQTSGETGTASLLVTNGGAPVTTGMFGTITNSVAVASAATATGLLTLTAANTFVPGNFVVAQGLATNTVLDGTIASVISTSLTNALFEAQGWSVVAGTHSEASGTAALLTTGTPAGIGEVPAGTNLSGETVQIGGFGGVY